MTDNDWVYETAKDSGLSFINRLREFPREPDPFVYSARIASALAIRAAVRMYNRFDITGRQNLPADRSFVLVANHASHFDAIALLSALPIRALHRAYPIAARDYFGSNAAFLALATVVANVMLFDRNAKGKDDLTLCRQLLEEPGNVFVLFPEGTRSIDGRLGIFKRGIGLLLAGTNHPVVPCHLEGTHRALPKGALIPRPARVHLTIGEPRTYEKVECNDEGALQICADLRRSVMALAGETQPQATRPVSQEAY